jgi:hypothetical protein
MTTADIESLADFEGTGAPDFPAGKTLRRNVVPDFFSRVGLVEWRRFRESLAFAANTSSADMSADFSVIEAIWKDADSKLTYIGDNQRKMMEAAANTTPAAPSQYYLTFNSTAPVKRRKVNLGAPTDAAYTLTVFGWITPYFSDDTTPVDLNPYIPEQFQWGLVEGLKAQIFRVRYGIQDPRTMDANQEFLRIVEDAKQFRETTLEETPRYA